MKTKAPFNYRPLVAILILIIIGVEVFTDIQILELGMLGYIAIASIAMAVFVLRSTYEAIQENGLKKALFKAWLWLSAYIGILAFAWVVYMAFEHTHWSVFVILIYGGAVTYLNRENF